MCAVNILYSKSIDKFYIGSCVNLDERLNEHTTKKYSGSYTAKVDDWVLFYFITELEYKQARKIEGHIKGMKSKKYINDLKKYLELILKLKNKYCV